MRGVPGAGDQARLDRDLTWRRRPQLFFGAVGIVRALQRKHRHLDVGQEAGDVEVAKARIEPGVVPASERDIDVGVIAREARAQVAGFILGADPADAFDVQVFDEEMRGDRYETEENIALVPHV